ncbi:glutamine synthetase family protein [Cognatishimia sp. MH4019]|uniref:glutamine synthetase family protein n=1 Tax=Cognatishimia sp. MH4019 TaxID=2854030 RepID=UPI001CD71F66|nr:glutamine synthetase family protein [Cognatishimia sp. MH4019]
MTSIREAYDTYCAQYGPPDRIEMMMCDLNAVLRGKWLPGEDISKLQNGDVRLPLSAYAANIGGHEVDETGLGSIANDPDGVVIAVPESMSAVPWASDKVLQVLVDLKDENDQICLLSSRNMLRKMLDRFEGLNLSPVVATELEFHIIQTRETSSEAPKPLELSPDAQCYDLDAMADQQAILNEIMDTCAVQGIAADTLIAEYGPGQFEVNFHHTNDVMHAADTVILFRRMVRGILKKHGLGATFMAKPYADSPGNGMHVHVSLNDGENRNIFSSTAQSLSPTLGSAVAGVLSSMQDLQAVFAPHMNSFRRFQTNSFAPTTPDWGIDNRNAAVRIPEISGRGARLKHRICGADVNPYLALTAILGGILHGLEHKLTPPLALEDPACRPAPPLEHDWKNAVERFANSTIAKAIFGVPFIEVYSAIRRSEIDLLRTPVTPAEYAYYLGRM